MMVINDMEKNTKETISQVEPILGDRDGTPSTSRKKAFRTILLGVAAPCLPILTFTALLLWMTYGQRLPKGAGWPELIPQGSNENRSHWQNFRATGGPNILVDYSATQITTVSSWSSKLLPYLTGTIMALVAFLAARRIVQESKRGNDNALPSPPQLTIMIDLLSGDSFKPLINTIFMRSQTGEKLIAPIPTIFWCLFGLTTLGCLIPLIDTWFGVTTKAVAGALIDRVDVPSSDYNNTNGYQLNSTLCHNGPLRISDSDSIWPCNLIDDNGYTANYFEVAEGLNVLKAQRLTWPNSLFYGKAPELIGIDTFNGPDRYNRCYDEPFYFYSNPATTLDYLAQTVAISTACEIVTENCVTEASSSTFSCSPAMSGDMAMNGGFFPQTVYPSSSCFGDNCTSLPIDSSGLGLIFSNSSALDYKPKLVNTSLTNKYVIQHPEFLIQNPTYFGFWAANYPDDATLWSLSADQRTESRSNTYKNNSAGPIWFASCNSTVYDVTYTRLNESGKVDVWNASIASPETAALFMLPLSMFYANTILSDAIVELASYSALHIENVYDLRKAFAGKFSQTALAQAMSVYSQRPNLKAQRTTYVIVTQLPLVPFWILIGAKLTFMLLVIGLAVGAYAFAHPMETEAVLDKLSTKGLAGAYFDDPRLLQKNAVAAIAELTDMDKKESVMAADPKSGAQVTTTGPVPANAESSSESAKIGLMPDAEGTYKYVVRVNGVWKFLEPFATASTKAMYNRGV